MRQRTRALHCAVTLGARLMRAQRHTGKRGSSSKLVIVHGHQQVSAPMFAVLHIQKLEGART
jgi:hypothetical protein